MYDAQQGGYRHRLGLSMIATIALVKDAWRCLPIAAKALRLIPPHGVSSDHDNCRFLFCSRLFLNILVAVLHIG